MSRRWGLLVLVLLLSGCASGAGGMPEPGAGSDVSTLRQRVEQDVTVWQQRGVEISSVELSRDGRRVVVGTPQPDRMRSLAAERYGPGAPLDIVRGGPVRPVSPS
jgi:alkylation response protein AidB-like acyl-CoA dehydrogenase